MQGPLAGDIHPGNFWTSSPMNIWRHNVGAGSCGFGFWFELPGNPGGESSTPTVCCAHNPVGGEQSLWDVAVVEEEEGSASFA